MVAPDYQPIVVAHRGIWGPNEPENSIPAFLNARQNGFPSECDIQLSADGEPVVIHDETLDRTATACGRVDALPVSSLRQVTLRTIAQDLPRVTVPALAEASGLVYLVEVKPADAPVLVRKVIEAMAGRNWVLQSFDGSNLLHAVAHAPKTRVALLGEDDNSVNVAVNRGWPLHLSHELVNDRIAARLRDAGLPLGVWTVGAEHLGRLLPYRPQVFISDEPILVRGALSRAGITPAGQCGAV